MAVDDQGTQDATPATYDVSFDPVNDAPVVDLNGAAAGTGTTVSHTEGGPQTYLAWDATVSDVDSADFNGGSLTVAVTQGNYAGLNLSIDIQGNAAGELWVSGNTLSYGGVPIGTISGNGNGSPLVIQFAASGVSQEAVQALVKHIRFFDTSDNPSGIEWHVAFTLTDGDGGTSTVATADVTTTPVNDAPTTASSATGNPEDTPLLLSLIGQDVDGTVSFFRITTLPQNGGLFLDQAGTQPIDPDHIPATSNANQASIWFRPDPNFTGTTSFEFVAVDDQGAEDATPATYNVTFDPVNDAPVATNDTVSVSEDAATTGVGAILKANDTDAENNTLTITGVGNATRGSVSLNGGNPIFTAETNFSGRASFEYTISDGQGGTSTATVTVNVAPVADMPTFTLAEPAPGPLGDEFQVNTRTAFQQENASVAALSDGGFVVMWHSQHQDFSGYGVYGQRYDASGRTVGAEFRANTYTASEQVTPAVVGLVGGGFAVMWASLNQDGSDWGVYGQVYGADGNPAGNEFRANTFTSSYQSTPALAALPGGGFVATWMSYNQDGNGAAVIAQRFDAAGNQVGTEFQANTYTNNEQYNPAIATFADGGFVITWQSFTQEGSDHGVYAQRYNADGSAAGGEFHVNTTTASDQTDPSVAVLGDGSFVIAWQSLDQDGSLEGIFARHYAANGTPIGGEFAVNTFTSGNQTAASIVVLADGGFLVSWMSNGQDSGIYAQAFDAAGNRVGDEFRINQSTAGQQQVGAQEGGAPIAVLASGNIVQVWHGAPQIWGDEIHARFVSVADYRGIEDHTVTLTGFAVALADTDGSEFAGAQPVRLPGRRDLLRRRTGSGQRTLGDRG